MRARRLALAILAVHGCSGPSDQASSADRVAGAVLESRFTAGRFGRQTAWHPCTVTDTASVVVRVRCAPPPAPGSRRFDEIERSLAGARAELGPDSAAAVLHALALVELAWRDSEPAAVTRAVAKLEAASRRAPDDAVLLNDLAVAYLALAERDQKLEPMLRALDAVNRALGCDSTLTSALFTRALVLDRLYLVAPARQAWSKYVAVETDPKWRAEAEGYLRRLTRRVDPVALPETADALLGGDTASTHKRLRTLVRLTVGSPRDFGFVLLGEWSDAIRRGDSAQAARLLGATRSVAAALDSSKADRSVALALAEIDAADRARRTSLAAAYDRLGAGRELFARSAFDSAVLVLGEAERELSRLRSGLALWARYYRAAANMSRGDYKTSDAEFRAIIEQAPSEQPALVGRSMMGLGLSRARRGEYELAMEWYRRAVPYVARAAESDAEGWVAHLLGEALGFAGQAGESDRETYRALRMLSPFRRLTLLNYHLSSVAGVARNVGASAAALDVMDEMLDIARAVAKPDVLALTLCTRARDLIAVGRTDAAAADLAEAERWASMMTPGRGRERLNALVVLARGEILRDRDPAAAVPIFERAVAELAPFGTDILVPIALYNAGEAARRSGNLGRARLRLGEAIGQLERQQQAFRTPALRAAFSETVEKVFDAMIVLEIDAGRPEAAFEYLERARLITWTPDAHDGSPATGRGPTGITDLARRLPGGVLLLEYAVLGDRLAVWAVSRHGWRHETAPAPRDTVRALVDRFLREVGLETPRALETRARLFDLLLRPVEGELRAASRVTTIADRELYRVAFGALWDRASRRYAVESHEFRSAPSGAFLVAALSARPAQSGVAAALVVANPSSTAAVERGLGALPGARAEGDLVAQLYRSRSLLTGGDAHRGRVLKLLDTASIFHFAGHAVFDPDRPERSYLALAPADETDDGILQAREIAGLRLSNLQLVVLSACTSASPRATRMGAVAGLAYSFMRAGAPATISTLWDVSDDATTELLVAFHRHVTQAVAPSEALRLAQLEALRSTSPRRRAIRAWAAFTYTGP